jgi:hypothetical protein
MPHEQNSPNLSSAGEGSADADDAFEAGVAENLVATGAPIGLPDPTQNFPLR